jgi:hypothetical protein
METWLQTAAQIGAIIKERDRQLGELVAIEMLVTKNNRLGNTEVVDILLDSLSTVQKEMKVTDEIIKEWYNKDITELRMFAVETAVALEKYEEIVTELAGVERTLAILIAGKVFNDETEKLRDELLETRKMLRIHQEKSVEFLDSMFIKKEEETSTSPVESASVEESNE